VWAVARALADELPLRGIGGRALPVAVQRLSARHGWGAGPALDERRVPRLVFEVTVAGYFGVAAWNLGTSPALIATLLFAPPLLTILLVDWWTRYIYTGVTIVGAVTGLAVAFADGWAALTVSTLAALGAGGIFAGAYWLAGVMFGEGEEVPFGSGDVYLATMIGAMAGFPGVVAALFAGAALAAAAGLLLLVTRRRSRHDIIPYGSFLCLGALLTFLIEGG
jgi:leader peptidase (prepilin peptidase) / N-methyltransferase